MEIVRTDIVEQTFFAFGDGWISMTERKESAEEKEHGKEEDLISQEDEEQSGSQDSKGVLEATGNEADQVRRLASNTKPRVPPPPNGGYGTYTDRQICCAFLGHHTDQ